MSLILSGWPPTFQTWNRACVSSFLQTLARDWPLAYKISSLFPLPTFMSSLEFANKKFILSIDFDTDLGYRVQFVGRNNRMWSVSQLHWGQGEGMATQAFALGPGHAPRFLAST